MPLNVHILVRKQAEAMANELFEIYARENRTYRMWLEAGGTPAKARRVFVSRMAPKLYEDARLALTDVLAQPDEKVPVAIKNEIAEALIADHAHRGNRTVDAGLANTKRVVPKHLH